MTRTPEIQVLDVDKIQKKPRVANPNHWHPKLKAALEGPLREAGNPTFKKDYKLLQEGCVWCGAL